MPTEIHCSACDAVVQAGNQFCPVCGLQLTAQAVPAVYVEGPRFPFWPTLAAAIALLWAITYILDAVKK